MLIEREYSIPTMSGRAIRVTVPFNVTSEDIELLLGWIGLTRPALIDVEARNKHIRDTQDEAVAKTKGPA